VDRDELNTGYCGVPDKYKVARVSLHMWEEPCISGEERNGTYNGSGTIFFTGCNLGCIYCQNRDIAKGEVKKGRVYTEDELIKKMFLLKNKGANNINLVTPSHYIHLLPETLKKVKNMGLDIPIVYNTSSYEKVENIKKLDGLVDVYLPDFKYMDEEKAMKYSFAKDYPKIADEAIEEMVRQTGRPQFDANGLIKKGVIVRHLVLPLAVNNAKNVISHLYDKYGDDIYISVMNQYTPPKEKLIYEELNRKVTKREYEKVLDYIVESGITHAYIQEGDVADESFIPDFDDSL